MLMDLSSIHQRLSEGPHAIEQAATEAAEKRDALHKAKRWVEKVRAIAIVTNATAKNQTILNALVENDPLVDAAEAEVIQAHANYLMAVAKHERAKDEFDAVRKQANLLETSIRSGIHG